MNAPERSRLIKNRFLYFVCIMAAVLLALMPLYNLSRYAMSDSAEVLVLENIKKITAAGKNYVEAAWLSNGDCVLVWYDQDSSEFKADQLYLKDNEYRMLGEDVKDFSVTGPSPWFPARISSADLEMMEVFSNGHNLVRIVRGEKETILPGPGMDAFSPSISGLSVIFCLETNGFRRIASWREGTISLLTPSDFGGHFYNPYYWKAGDILFYNCITANRDSRLDASFAYKVCMVKSGKAPVEKISGMGNEMELRPFKVSGNADGSVFAHNEMALSNNYLLFYHTRYFPFRLEKKPESGFSYKTGYRMAFPELLTIYSFSFSASDPQRMLLVGMDGSVLRNQAFDVIFNKQVLREFSLTEKAFLINIISLIVAVFFVFLLILPAFRK